MLILGIWFLWSLLQIGSFSYLAMRAWIGGTFGSVLLVLLSATLAYHSSLGVQVVIEDYVHKPSLKIICLVFNRFIHFFLAATATLAVLRIALGVTA